MIIVEIAANARGGHANQEFHGVVPNGWAIKPDDMICENFPFGDITVDDNVPPVITSWTPLPIPEPEPEPEPELSVWDELDAAYREGVDSV